MSSPNVETTERWVKYHVRCLRPVSSVRKVSRADRATFMDYVALARWQDPFRGCLCDEDGTPWGRKKCAELLGESYGTIKRAEDALAAAGLITFQQVGVDHKDSRGRVHVANYDEYQARYGGYDSVAPEATELKADPQEATNPKPQGYDSVAPKATILKPPTSDGEGYDSEASNPERSTGATTDGDPTSDGQGYDSDKSCPVDVVENNQTIYIHESLVEQVRQQLSIAGVTGQAFDALWMGVSGGSLPHFETVVLDAAMITAQWAIGLAERGKPQPNAQAVAQYFRKTLRSQSEEEGERDNLRDDDERLFVRLYGPRPRNAFWTQEQAWDRELVGFRRDREHWLYSHCATGCEEKLRKRAEECGLWDDGLIERVRGKIMAGGYE